jgi:dolichol-phosphate mannosyltransferase
MLSVVIPFYNEIKCVEPLLSRLREMLRSSAVGDYEIVVVDNGSTEEQHKQLMALCQDSRIRVITLSRNFGYQGALWAGLDHAKGDPVIFMDGDGEDPPEVIPLFLEKWREGYDVVYGVRVSRKVNWFMNKCYQVFYRALARWSNFEIPLDAGEFSLVHGRALAALRSFKDRTRMLRILRAWIGYRQIGIPYHREARIGGRSHFNFLGAFAFAWDGFVAATDIPVRLSIYSALGCFFCGILGSIYYLFWYFFARVKIPGFASLNITLLFLFSVLFICFSIQARYIITLLDETRRRPPYLVAKGDEDPQSNKPSAPPRHLQEQT